MKLSTLFLIVLIETSLPISAGAVEYAVASKPTPVLNSPDFNAVFGGSSGHNIKVDHCGQVRELEYIALPGTLFTIIKRLHSGTAEIFQVETNEYKTPPKVRLYVAGSYLISKKEVTNRKPSLPQFEMITALLRSSVGTPYVWGGNVLNGVPEPAEFFFKDIKNDDSSHLTLAGVDCSGLLYFATNGWTPRNTSQLVTYGKGVAIAGKQSTEIAALLEPLDLITWNGHVIIVLDRQTAIESRLKCGEPGNGGVILTPLSQRIAEIMRSRLPEDSWSGVMKRKDIFVVRRWYTQPQAISDN